MASNPTCTVCSKFVGYEIFGLESLCDLLDLILFLSVFFFRSASSGSVVEMRKQSGSKFVKPFQCLAQWHEIIASTHLLAEALGPEVDRGRFHHDCWSAWRAVPEACLRHSTSCRVNLQLSLVEFVYVSLSLSLPRLPGGSGFSIVLRNSLSKRELILRPRKHCDFVVQFQFSLPLLLLFLFFLYLCSVSNINLTFEIYCWFLIEVCLFLIEKCMNCCTRDSRVIRYSSLGGWWNHLFIQFESLFFCCASFVFFCCWSIILMRCQNL